MEEAQKSGDPNAQMQAAMQGLGAILLAGASAAIRSGSIS